MKHTKILCSIILALILSFSFFMPTYKTAVYATTSVTRYGKNLIPKMSNSAALNFVYERIVEGCATPEYGEKIDLTHPTYKVSKSELHIVVDLVYADYPEYFWLTNGYSYLLDTAKPYIEPKYVTFDGKTMTGNTQKTAKAELDSKVAQLTQDLDGKSQYEQARLLHDRLAATTDYVSNDLDQTAYGALVKGKAVCAGYAKAYQLLLQEVGITSWYIRGDGVNLTAGTTEPHAWNAVLLDGKWYYTDVTWDDKSNLYYAYFNVTSDIFSEDHIPNDGTDRSGQACLNYKAYQPNATATDANYHAKNNLRFNAVDVDGFAAVLKNTYPCRVYITGDNTRVVSDLKAKFREIVTKMGVPTTAGYSYSVSYQGREYIITYSINDSNHVHTTSLVPAVTPSCMQEGNTAYYTCGCGKWFSNSAATNEITNKNSVKLSSTKHADANRDNKCDHCGTILAAIVTAPPRSSTPAVSTPTAPKPSATPTNNTPVHTAPTTTSTPPTYTFPSYTVAPFTIIPLDYTKDNSLVTLSISLLVIAIGGSIVACIIMKK